MPVDIDGVDRTSGPGRPSRQARTVLIGVLIVTLGLAASTVLAIEWRANALSANRRSFESTVANLDGALDSKLETSIDLTRAVRGIATMEPTASNTCLQQGQEQLETRAATGQDVVAAWIQAVS